jgi:heterodisulfide reductase subunit A
MRVGVFICHCGNNIAGTVDVAKVAEETRKIPGVAYATTYMYTCSEPGQNEIKEAITREGLDRVVVAACSPRMHELTFRRTVEKAGLNRYFFEMANIREHISWIGENKELNTTKATEALRMAVAKVMQNKPLYSTSFKVNKRVLVIGGGVAGMQAALDCADGGLDVLLVEKSPSVGGMMARLDKTFPTIDCSICILGPKMVDVAQHDKITLHAYSEIDEIKGYVGNYQIKIRKKATYVDWSKCTGCGACMEKCPSKNAYAAIFIIISLSLFAGYYAGGSKRKDRISLSVTSGLGNLAVIMLVTHVCYPRVHVLFTVFAYVIARWVVFVFWFMLLRGRLRLRGEKLE